MSRNSPLVAAKVYISRRFYTIHCTQNQAITLMRMGSRAKDNPTQENIHDYETLVKLLIYRHKQRKQEIEEIHTTLWSV